MGPASKPLSSKFRNTGYFEVADTGRELSGSNHPFDPRYFPALNPFHTLMH